MPNLGSVHHLPRLRHAAEAIHLVPLHDPRHVVVAVAVVHATVVLHSHAPRLRPERYAVTQ